VRRIDGDVVLGRKIGEHLRDGVHAVVIVFLNAVAFHEWVDHHQVDLVFDDGGFEVCPQLAFFELAAALVAGHEFARLTAGRGEVEPAVNIVERDVVM